MGQNYCDWNFFACCRAFFAARFRFLLSITGKYVARNPLNCNRLELLLCRSSLIGLSKAASCSGIWIILALRLASLRFALFLFLCICLIEMLGAAIVFFDACLTTEFFMEINGDDSSCDCFLVALILEVTVKPNLVNWDWDALCGRAFTMMVTDTTWMRTLWNTTREFHESFCRMILNHRSIYRISYLSWFWPILMDIHQFLVDLDAKNY